jgi:hypothetical protein
MKGSVPSRRAAAPADRVFQCGDDAGVSLLDREDVTF